MNISRAVTVLIALTTITLHAAEPNRGPAMKDVNQPVVPKAVCENVYKEGGWQPSAYIRPNYYVEGDVRLMSFDLKGILFLASNTNDRGCQYSSLSFKVESLRPGPDASSRLKEATSVTFEVTPQIRRSFGAVRVGDEVVIHHNRNKLEISRVAHAK